MDEKQLGAWYASADSYYQPLLHGYDNAPMWQVEPRNIPYRDALAARICRAGRRRPTGHWPKAVAKYVVVDMFAKACAGASTKEVIKNAEAQLKEIYRPRDDAATPHPDPLPASGERESEPLAPLAGRGRGPRQREGEGHSPARPEVTLRSEPLVAASAARAGRVAQRLARPRERVQLADDGAAAAVSGGAGRLSVLSTASC